MPSSRSGCRSSCSGSATKSSNASCDGHSTRIIAWRGLSPSCGAPSAQLARARPPCRRACRTALDRPPRVLLVVVVVGQVEQVERVDGHAGERTVVAFPLRPRDADARRCALRTERHRPGGCSGPRCWLAAPGVPPRLGRRRRRVGRRPGRGAGRSASATSRSAPACCGRSQRDEPVARLADRRRAGRRDRRRRDARRWRRCRRPGGWPCWRIAAGSAVQMRRPLAAATAR